MEPPNTRRKYVGCNATVTWHPPSPKNKIKWHTSKNIVSEYSQYTGHCWRNENGKKNKTFTNARYQLIKFPSKGYSPQTSLAFWSAFLIWYFEAWLRLARRHWEGLCLFRAPVAAALLKGGGADRADIPLDGEWHGGWLSFRWLRSLEIVGVPKREGCGIDSAGSCCRLFCGGAAGCNSVRLRRRTRSPVSTLQELGDMLSTTWP